MNAQEEPVLPTEAANQGTLDEVRQPQEAIGSRNARSETLERIRRAAEATLECWPAAKAVLLFGSRVRGDHGPTSDWDIAVVTDGSLDCPPDLPILELSMDNLDTVFIAADDIRRHRNRLSHLGCALSRDAVALAGDWERPKGLREPELNNDSYLNEIENSQVGIVVALDQLRTGMGLRDPVRAQAAANRFVSRTADAAKHLAKALLLRNGHQPQRIRDLAGLASRIAGRDADLAEKIGSLNGGASVGHVAHCGDSPDSSPDEISQSIRRLCRTADLLAEEMPHYRRYIPSIAFDNISAAASRLSEVEPATLNRQSASDSVRSAEALRQGRQNAIAAATSLRSAWEATSRRDHDEGPAAEVEMSPDDGGP